MTTKLWLHCRNCDEPLAEYPKSDAPVEGAIIMHNFAETVPRTCPKCAKVPNFRLDLIRERKDAITQSVAT